MQNFRNLYNLAKLFLYFNRLKILIFLDEGGVATIKRKPRKTFEGSLQHRLRSQTFNSRQGSFYFLQSKTVYDFFLDTKLKIASNFARCSSVSLKNVLNLQ